jgi:hypothetical protein
LVRDADARPALALLIATGIGLHNFGEGACDRPVRRCRRAVAGTGADHRLHKLHSATEGFGIVGPMSGEAEMPSLALSG